MHKFILSVKFIIIFCIFHLSCFSSVFSQDPFIVKSNTLKIIPTKHLTFLEGYDESVSYQKLENSKWTKRLMNPQSMVNGYWVRFEIQNDLENDILGLNHNMNREKKLFIRNSLGVEEYDYWKVGLNKQLTDDRIGTNHRVKAPKGEITVIYDFFRNYPVDRWNSKDNFHRMMIGSWNELRNKELRAFIGRIIFIAPAFVFGIYFFFVFLISKGNYIWISLSLFMLTIITAGPITPHYSFLNIFPSVSSPNGMIFLLPLLSLFLLIFFKNELNLKEYYPKLNITFSFVIFFYVSMIILSFIQLLNWPSEDQLNLIKYPPDNLGPGIIKIHFIMIPFILLLFLSIFISFKSWKKGNSSSGYLCLSFVLPFLIIPIALISYLFIGGFNSVFWNIVMPFSGLFFLGMFVTFGFSVAQGINDLKSDFLEQQIKLNDNLESQVKLRTSELTDANELITETNQLITQSINTASIIQNAILPEIDCNTYGFNEFEYMWEPRDIVGGDFYWLDKHDDWTSFVVADCTGHGIPGAFMTLISSTLLDRVKSLDDLSQPYVILNQLDELLESKLRLKENKATEFGMDIGICSFSQKNNLLRFSGAKMNLYKVFDNVVNEFKGNKISRIFRETTSNRIYKS